jgi:hypothetical protein
MVAFLLWILITLGSKQLCIVLTIILLQMDGFNMCRIAIEELLCKNKGIVQ